MLFLTMLCINITIYAKYIFEATYTVASIDIDRNPPKIELLSLENTNTGYEKYANQTHTITAKVKVTEKNIIENHFGKEKVKILIQETAVNPEIYEIKELERNNESIIYQIKLSKLTGNGKLKIVVEEGTIKDKSDNINEETIFDTGIQIDNIAPNVTFSEEESTQGKVLANVTSNEAIRKMEGWNISESKLVLTKEFTNNVSYTFEVMDLAQNKTKVEINITKATNINIVYGSHNSEVGWTFGYGNYDVAGKTAIQKNPAFKTEALAFHVDGNIDKDFIQAQAFVYSYWGEGSEAICNTYHTRYSYGYNPSKTTYASMASGTIVNIQNKKCFMLGGSGVNAENQTDANGQNIMPQHYVGTYSFGISGIKMKLKDTSYYSIVYQILVNNYGWQNVASDGQETMYRYNKPISAFRMALIPKTEKQYLINSWNKDVGTYNMK